MQVMCLNGVVEESETRRAPQETFSLPEDLKEPLGELWQRIGVKQKWEAYTAAILAFYRMTNEEQDVAMDAVVAARRRHDFKHLLRRDVGDEEEETSLNGPGPSPARAAKKPRSVDDRGRGRPKRASPKP
jgi:hypothetical protein